ncbi:MAG: hypothetical protein OXR64_01490 [Chloroflexota bacterium]|nr:hypothetical protein [Chloroflexota bacterium]MDE2918501.1 hypothetical protein [Chloroflexota bacterium]
MAGETSGEQQPRTIKNVGVLDMRKATTESFSRPTHFENVGMLVYSPESRHLLAQAAMGNVGVTLEASTDAQLVQGEVTISAVSLKNRTAPLSLVVMGQVVIAEDVKADVLEEGLGELAALGVVICPERLAGTVQSKLTSQMGGVKTYRGGDLLSLVTERLVLDDAFLRSLPDASQVVAVGSVDAWAILPNELIARKIESLEVMGGKVRCRGENAEAIHAVLDQSMGATVRAVPVGFTPMRRLLRLNRTTLGMLPSRRVYCPETVIVGDDIEAEDLQGALEALVAEDLLICPARLQAAIGAICKLADSKPIFYEGELWLIGTVETLRPSRFDFLKGKATLVVTGVLQIDCDVDPTTLYERLHAVHNFGVISCTPDQQAALRARLEIDAGAFSETTESEEDEGSPGMQNIGVLTL